MSAKSKSKSRSKAKGKKRARGEAPVTESRRAGLQMPVRRIRKYVRDGRYAPRLSRVAPVYLSAVLEYCVAEVLELAGNAAKDNKKKTIGPRHVMLGIRQDEELGKLCQGVIFPKAGVVQNIHPNLVPIKKKKKKKKETKKGGSSQSY